MSNYTPLDISLMLRARDQRLSKNKRDGFDRVFFPFSIIVLIMSLSFYAVRLIIEITGPSRLPVTEPTQAPKQTVKEFTQSAVPSVPIPQVYHDVNGILVDAERVLATAEAQYPDLSRAELVEIVNKSVIQWAALRQYYKDNPNIVDRLSIKTTHPIATFGAVLRDVGVLVAEYDKEKEAGKTNVDALVELFTANSKIR